MGDGSTVVEDLETGQLLILLHDCAEDDPFEELADSFDELILEQKAKIMRGVLEDKR
ncbi:hypothetical protein [Paenibacillus sp. E194]|uniref:hypothetical protein n=1 Tax=Paenibacillus sp. E194 TaxID=1458845 RepID=UPI0012E0594C|nr:hypothetical protein [Paenibacillus sp. E194]